MHLIRYPDFVMKRELFSETLLPLSLSTNSALRQLYSPVFCLFCSCTFFSTNTKRPQPANGASTGQLMENHIGTMQQLTSPCGNAPLCSLVVIGNCLVL